jgi:hypothetical protein
VNILEHCGVILFRKRISLKIIAFPSKQRKDFEEEGELFGSFRGCCSSEKRRMDLCNVRQNLIQ